MIDLDNLIDFLSAHPDTHFKIVHNPESLDQDAGTYNLVLAVDGGDNAGTKVIVNGITRENISFHIGAMVDSMKWVLD
jgi:hypothetical protein